MGNFKWQVGDCGCGCKRTCGSIPCIVTHKGVFGDINDIKNLYFNLNYGDLYIQYLSVLPYGTLDEGYYKRSILLEDEEFPAEGTEDTVLPVQAYNFASNSSTVICERNNSYYLTRNGYLYKCGGLALSSSGHLVYDPLYNDIRNELDYNDFFNQPADTPCIIHGCKHGGFYNTDQYNCFIQNKISYAYKPSGFESSITMTKPHPGVSFTGISGVELVDVKKDFLLGSNGYSCLFLHLKLRFNISDKLVLTRSTTNINRYNTDYKNTHQKNISILQWNDFNASETKKGWTGWRSSKINDANGSYYAMYLSGKNTVLWVSPNAFTYLCILPPGEWGGGTANLRVPYLQEVEAQSGYALDFGLYDNTLTRSGTVEYQGKVVNYNGSNVYFLDADSNYIGPWGLSSISTDFEPNFGTDAFFPDIVGCDGNKLILERNFIDFEYVVAHIGCPAAVNYGTGVYRGITYDEAAGFISSFDFQKYFQSSLEYYDPDLTNILQFKHYPQDISVSRLYSQYAYREGISAETGQEYFKNLDYCSGFGDV